MIDLFEREAGKITSNGIRADLMSIEDKITPRKEFPLVRAIVVAAQVIHVRSKVLEPVYEYWMDKRRRLGKALMRQFQEPPPRGNTDPHVAFRLRTEGRRISKRNPRKDDHSGYFKMQYLRKDFDKLLHIVENVQIREQLKRESALMSIAIFDAKLQASPWGQKQLKDNPIVAAAIQQQQSTPVPSPSTAGAPIPTIPSTINTQELLRLYKLLQSDQPPCTYTHADFLSVIHHKASTSNANKHRNVSSTVHKSSNNKSDTSHTDKHKHNKSVHKGTPSSSTNATHTNVASSSPSIVDYDDDFTDDEDLLSDDDEDEAFFSQVEAHVKRIKLSHSKEMADIDRSIHSMSTDHKMDIHSAVAHKTQEHSSSFTLKSEYPPTFQSIITPSLPSPLIRAPATGAAIAGYCRPVVGRGNLLFIETVYMPMPTNTPTNTAHNPYAHAYQQHTNTTPVTTMHHNNAAPQTTAVPSTVPVNSTNVVQQQAAPIKVQ